jgi:hypothetical protein
MKKDSKYIWYIIDIIIFLAINYYILTHLPGSAIRALGDINWFTIFVFGLGIYRLTDVITHEDVTEIIRAPFMNKVVVDGVEKWEYAENGIRGFFGILFSCNACMGVWVSMIIFYLYIFFPIPTLIFVIIMSLTGLERFFSKIENFLAKRG